MKHSEKSFNPRLIASVLAFAACASATQAQLLHRYDFSSGATDIVGGANGTLLGPATTSAGQLMFNNPNFSPSSFAGGYAVLPANILPGSGSVTIETWFTLTGSGFFTESWAFTDRNGGVNPPGASSGQYFMQTVSNPQGGPN